MHNPLHDATAQLWATAFSYFRKATVEGANGEQAWTTEDDPLCTFTGGAAERIAALLKTKSFAARLNPKKLIFADLQNVNVDKLATVWPPSPNAKSGLPYDGNSVDQSYFNHLAFGFGNNCAAIEQYALSADCPLHRTKWDERPDYLRSTIIKAVAIPKQWKRRNSAVAQRAAPAPPAPVVPGTLPIQASQQIAAPVGQYVVPPPPSSMPVVVPALPSMIVNSKGELEGRLDYVRRQLETDGMLSFDTFRGEPMIQRGVTLAPMTDKDYIDLRTSFEREKGFAPVAKDTMRDAVLAESQRRLFDSGIEWLDAQVWDGVPRVERFMSTHFGAEDDEYTRAVGLYMWSGLAGRMYEPGCQLDMVIALQSRQGTGKSTGLKALASDPDYFTDGLSLHEDDDNFKRLLKGKVIVEIAELAGLSKGDINVVKRTITRTAEEWIEKYQTTKTKYLRRCMLFASTNENEFLPPDETGQRRWLPVVIAEINRELVTADRAQLWAEGAAIWKARGIQYAEAERLAVGKHKAHEVTDLWITRIGEWLNTAPSTGDPPYLRALAISEVLEGAIHMQPSHMDAKAGQRAGRVLRQLGYVSKNVKIGGHVVKRWGLNIPPPPPA